MSLFLEIGVCGFFVAWFAVSVASQFSDRVGDRFPRMAVLGLVPLWTFFAPRPGMHDMHLLYRDRLIDGSLGESSYVPLIEARRWYHAVFNPQKFRNKVFSDLADSLITQHHTLIARGEGVRVVMLSTPYLMMLNLVMRMPRTPYGEARQFIIARSKSFDPAADRALVFLSEFHHYSAS
jgi:hypothetical protein